MTTDTNAFRSSHEGTEFSVGEAEAIVEAGEIPDEHPEKGRGANHH